tara:strand:- start:25 stop:891 length:867 start_codon:yes stop_codon:yes gene_type:complete
MVEELSKYNFFETVRWFLKQKQLSENDLLMNHCPINFQTNRSNGFPARDVEYVQLSESHLTLVCNFFGLTGIPSPLPNYINEITGSEQGLFFRSFLEVLSQRFFVLYFLSYSTYKIENKNILHQLFEITQSENGQGRNALSHSLSAFESVSKSLFENESVRYQLMPGWIHIDEGGLLGHDFVLGDNSLLGEKILKDKQIVSYELHGSFDDLNRNPEKKQVQNFQMALKKSFGEQCRCVLIYFPTQDRTNRLGEKGFKLGSNAWINSAESMPVKSHRQQKVIFVQQPTL